MNRFMLLIPLWGVLPGVAAAADDGRILLLEQDVRTLQREVGRLSRELEQLRIQSRPGPAPLPRPPAPGQQRLVARSGPVATGQDRQGELEVSALLGPPASSVWRTRTGAALCDGDRTAGFLGGSVTLRDRAVVMSKRRSSSNRIRAHARKTRNRQCLYRAAPPEAQSTAPTACPPAGCGPGATEAIKWGSPVLEQERILFAYTAHKSHMNFMPTGSAMTPFKEELAAFRTGKDTIQFPYDKPLPKALIRRIAKHRVKQVEEGAKWMR